MFKGIVLSAVFVALSGCGAAYISPSVKSTEDGSVQVVPITPQSVSFANSSRYTPKQLPDVFFQNAGTGRGLVGAGATPTPALDEQFKPAALELRAPPALAPRKYQIGVGDVLLLATKTPSDTATELNGLLAAQNNRRGYTVQDDGAIAIPDVGRVTVAGLTIEQAESVLFQALVEQNFDPSFSLEIFEFNSQRVSIGGEVTNPTLVPITLTGLKLFEAIAAAGGIDSADPEFTLIRLYRDGNLYQIPLSDYVNRPALQQTGLSAGDSIFVDRAFELAKAQSFFEQQITLTNLRRSARAQALEELDAEVSRRRAALAEDRSNFQARDALGATDRDYVYLTGEMNTPGRFPLPFEHTASLADALYSNKGFNTKTANPGQIYLIRGQKGGSQVTAYHLDASNVANIVMATNMELRPNDVVFVSEQPITRWNRVLQQAIPSLITSTVAAVTP